MDRMETKDRRAKNECRKNVVEKYDDKIDEDFATMQKTVEIAAGKVAHNTKAERAKLYRGSCCKMYEKDQEKKQAWKARAEHLTREEKGEKKTAE